MKKQTIKELYRLNYDDQPYALPRWYNKLIDKTCDQIDLRDIFSMILNCILPELAIERAIDFFIEDPFDGEMFAGQLLDLFVEKNELFFKSKSPQLAKMLEIIENMDEETAKSKEQWGYDYDFNEDGCKEYLTLLFKAKQIIKAKNKH